MKQKPPKVKEENLSQFSEEIDKIYQEGKIKYWEGRFRTLLSEQQFQEKKLVKFLTILQR